MRETLKKIGVFTLILFLSIGLTFANCKKEDNTDEENMQLVVLLLMLYINDLMSGNCVTISKDTADDGTTSTDNKVPTYTATSGVKPKAACTYTYGMRYTTSSSTAKEWHDASHDEIIARFDAATGCSEMSAYWKANKKDVETTTTLEEGLDSTTIDCDTVGNVNQLVTPNVNFDGKVNVYCRTAKAYKAYKATQKANNNYKWFLTGNAESDMTTNRDYIRKTLTAAVATNGWPTTATESARHIKLSELKTAAKKENASLLTAYMWAYFGVAYNMYAASSPAVTAAQAQACQEGLMASASTEAKNLAVKMYMSSAGLNGMASNGIEQSDVADQTEVIVKDLQCKYGDFNEDGAGNLKTVGTETNVKEFGTCPSKYPQF